MSMPFSEVKPLESGGAAFSSVTGGAEDSAILKRDQFLAAIDADLRSTVKVLLVDPQRGGRGLRMWLEAIITQDQVIPSQFPRSLVQVYLDDSEAVPLHDCAECGVAIPVHPHWKGMEGEQPQSYFPTCPCCGGVTGLYASWSVCREVSSE